MPLHVRGIVAADALEAAVVDDLRDELDEAGGGRTTIVQHDGLAAVATEVADDEVLPSRANLLAHTRILESLTEHVTVLPMRFGSVVPDGDTLIERFLAAEGDRLHAALGQVDGHVELRLRGRYEEAAVVSAVAADDPEVAKLQRRGGMDDKLRLGERIVAGIEARRDRDQAAVAEALTPYATAVVAGQVAEPLDAFVLSFLVARESLSGFDGRVEALAEAVAGMMHLELVGPMPPFSFATGS